MGSFCSLKCTQTFTQTSFVGTSCRKLVDTNASGELHCELSGKLRRNILVCIELLDAGLTKDCVFLSVGYENNDL